MTDELIKRHVEQLRMTGGDLADLCRPLADAIEALTSERDRLRVSNMQMLGDIAVAMGRIEALNLQIKDLKKLVFAAYCEGFNDGKDGGWIVGPTNQPWKASYTHKALITMEARDV